MTPPLDAEYNSRFAAALVSEIKSEMGRRDLSSRGLGRLIGRSSQYMSDRLDGGNPKTGQRVAINVVDLAAIGEALGIDASELMRRAIASADDYVEELAAHDSAGTIAEEQEASDIP